MYAYARHMRPLHHYGHFHRRVAAALTQWRADCLAGKAPRLIVCAPPRHGKSEFTSRLLPPWFLGADPSQELILSSYGQALANDMSRDARAIAQSQENRLVFPQFALSDDRAAVEQWMTSKGGGVKAVGVGGPLTGRGGHGAIDDPTKDAADAASPAVRASQKAWYQSVFRTRIPPGGGILLTLCMTGDTPVLMADGSVRRLEAIRSGDAIATYDNGRLSCSVINHHKCCGYDSVYEIRTTCGKVVRANARHPFLVLRNGALSWVKLRDLVVGDEMVKVSGLPSRTGSGSGAPMLRAIDSHMPEVFATDTIRTRNARTRSGIMANGLERFAKLMAAKLPHRAKVCAQSTTTLKNMLRAIVSGRPSKSATPNYGIDTESGPKITTLFSTPKADCAPFASDLQLKDLPRIGAASYASIIATPRAESEDCCATIATSPLAVSGIPQQSAGLSRTWIASIAPAGVDLVYDIEVDRTENFIANGLVSHNTRWHEDDLAGWLLRMAAEDPSADQWQVLSFPAIAEQDDDFRKAGEALHPERWPVAELLKIKATLSPYQWAALYQQSPIPDGGGRIKAPWLAHTYGALPHDADRPVQSWDTAIKAGQINDFSVCTTARKGKDHRLYVTDVHRRRMEFPELLAAAKSLALRDNPRAVLIEDKGSGQQLIQMLRRDRDWKWSIIPVTPTVDKITRMDAVTPWLESGRVVTPDAASWLADWHAELLAFPAATHDDQIDSLSQLLDYLEAKPNLRAMFAA